MTQITLDRPELIRRLTATRLEVIQGKRKPFDMLDPAHQAMSSFGPRPDCDSWHLSQPFPPLYRKHRNWRHNLSCVIDQWADRSYTPGESECFLFACQCLDAMLGTQFYPANAGRWEGLKEFYAHARAIGALDYFDAVGDRIQWQDAAAGDLLQIEDERDGKLYLHWGIVSDQYNEQICFSVHGLGAERIHSDLDWRKKRVWSLRDPMEVQG
jgi:hypothetical protein